MLYLSLIYHMHQPYYRNRLTGGCAQPWVRLHGTKDYLDMLTLLQEYPGVNAVINVVPSLLEQLQEYAEHGCRDDYFNLSLKPASQLTSIDKKFIRERFFSIHKDKCIRLFPRYQELLAARDNKERFSIDDYRDLQVLFNLAWIDPSWRLSVPEIAHLAAKARNYSEKDKRVVLEHHIRLLKSIIPAYKRAQRGNHIEFTVSPYYHPILPLIFDTSTARRANPATMLPDRPFVSPIDVQTQISEAIAYFTRTFGSTPYGMWPSEQGVSDDIIRYILSADIQWIVTDEGILFKSLNTTTRDEKTLYQPYTLEWEGKKLSVIFRDRNLSDLIGFSYHDWQPQDAVNDFMHRLENISFACRNTDALVTVAMDGENAWEYYDNDGRDFLSLLYQRLSSSEFVRTTTIHNYLAAHQAGPVLPRIAPGSWIFSEFSKWINHPAKCRTWEELAAAREVLHQRRASLPPHTYARACKQMLICEGSDWFWWAGEDPHGEFEKLFRMHLANLYTIIGESVPAEIKRC